MSTKTKRIKQEVKVYFDPDDITRLTSEAQSLNISRGDLIRTRALSSTSPTLNRTSYSEAIENAARTVSGIPRPQLEALVASVINTIHAVQTDA